MKVSKKNYFSKEASREFMGVSQFKRFRQCEARAKAELDGEWGGLSSDALLIGSYVHAWSEGKLKEFKEDHPKMYKKNGDIYAKYKICDRMIERLESFPIIAEYREGEKEVVITFELFGLQWKAMVDILDLKNGRLIDLKTTRSIIDKVWNDDYTKKVPFFEKYQYMLQMAVYQYGVKQVYGKELETIIIAVDKGDIPDVAIIDMTDKERFEKELKEVKKYAKRIQGIKDDIIEPTRCGKCDYCRSTKTLDRVINYKELM